MYLSPNLPMAGEKTQVVIVDTAAVIEHHQSIVADLVKRRFPLAMLMQFLVDYIVNEELRVSQQMQPLLIDWHAFVEESQFDARPYDDLLTSPAFDSLFYDLYLAIGRTQVILTAPFHKGVAGYFVFDGWLGSCFRLRRSSLDPTLEPTCRYPAYYDDPL